MGNKTSYEIPVYVRRSFDIMFDTNGYPHTEGNRQALYAETIKRMSAADVAKINTLALQDHDFVDNSFSDASSEAWDYCEENDMFRHFKTYDEEGVDEEDNLPVCCYDDAFFKDVNSKWPESKIKD